MRLVVVTGISGAGKVTALKIFEDNGYYCVDNLPIDLIESFADILFGQTNEKLSLIHISEPTRRS